MGEGVLDHRICKTQRSSSQLPGVTEQETEAHEEKGLALRLAGWGKTRDCSPVFSTPHCLSQGQAHILRVHVAP